jgi:hypothetical protein
MIMIETKNPNGSGELHAAYQIKRHLNGSLSGIGADKLERLRAGREQALTRQKKTSSSLAVAGAGSTSYFGFDLGWTVHLVPLLVLLAGLLAMSHWHQNRYAEELADIDVQMLADELPPAAYLDRGFDTWLKRGNQ